ncbi:hypothetical protein ACTMTU_16290 [Streptomyces sp. OZ13]|uniref:hypothetical protein n=1 Tax=Streptomyces sp. OZ13 TaxID=3452210 RepID=UPI003F8CCC99
MASQWWTNVRERAGKDDVDALIMRIAMNDGPDPGVLDDPGARSGSAAATDPGPGADAGAGGDAGPDLRAGPSADPGAPDLVTRLLCSALYVRPSRIGKRLLERRLRRERAGRTWRGRRRTVFLADEGTCPPLGEAAARWTPAFGRHRRRRAAELAEGQLRPEHPYDAQQRFVGAGLDLWAPAVPTTSLRTTGAGDGGEAEGAARPFGEAELLEHIGAALLRIEEAEGLTEPLPGFSVTQVVGIQAPLWLIRARGSKQKEPDLHDSRYAPSGRPERLYLRARCVTWQGQVTVTMFVNVALEAGRLRLTLRPHVMAPLHNRLILNVLREMLPLYQVVLSGLGESLLDSFTGALAPWYRRREQHGRVQDPVSVREHFSMAEISDMHQSDDERRLVVLMESCVFDAVSSFLKEHGIDSGNFDQQVSVIINNIQVFGDNLVPIQSITGAQVTGSSQHAGTNGAARAGRGATRRNAE